MRILLTLLFAASLAACGTSRKDLAAPLAYVPADTPYVFANIEPIPASAMDAYGDMLKPAQEAYARMLDDVRADIGQSGDSDEDKRKLLALIDLAADKLTIEGWERIGFTREGRMAMYGVGVMPVLRVELGDPEKLRAFIGELEALAGTPLPTAEVDGHNYWRLAPDGGKSFALVMAIIDRHLVLTVDAGADIAALPDLLGLRQPARSLLASGELEQINREFGYTPYGSFLLDTRRLATALLGAEGRDTWFTRSLADEGKTVSAVCRSEFMGMAEHLPRMLGGYTRLDGSAIDSHGLIELKPAVAQAFQGMTAPVPGLGSHDGAFSADVGFGLKLDKLAEFLQAQAMAITSAPYECEMLAGLNSGAAQLSSQTAGLYMAAGWFTGMRVVLERMEWDNGIMPDPDSIEGAMVIASPSPMGLIGMLKGFMPQLAALDLKPGAAPQPLPLQDMGAGEAPPSWIALTDSALALGFGSDAGTRLPAFLSAATPARAPLLHFSYQGAFYGGLMRKYDEVMGSAGQAALDSIDDGDEASSDADKARKVERQRKRAFEQRMQRYTQNFMAAMYSMYEAIDYSSASLLAGDRGLEMQQVVRLRR